MKLFFVGILVLSSYLIPERMSCDIQYKIKVTHTTDNLDNGKIEVELIKSSSRVRAFLVGDTVKKNRLDVKLKDLNNLAAGTYILILENDDCSKTERNIVIK